MTGTARKKKTPPSQAELQHCDPAHTIHGYLEYLKISRRDKAPMTWTEVWERFHLSYPDRWAIMLFPPGDRLVDEANIYHLYLMPENYHPGDCDISLKYHFRHAPQAANHNTLTGDDDE